MFRKENKMKYEVGQEVWVHFPWVDEDCWVQGTVLKETAKRIKVETGTRPDGYYAKHNVKAK
jgi:hypothetical protein